MFREALREHVNNCLVKNTFFLVATCLLESINYKIYMEQWKSLDIVNCPLYEVSDQGRIRRKSTHKIINPGVTELGYYRIRLRTKERTYKNFRVHRLVALAFIPNPENKPEVDHINHIRNDNRACNLRWLTHAENVYSSLEVRWPQYYS